MYDKIHYKKKKKKNLPARQETQVWSLGWKDPGEEGMATHSSIIAWRIPWTEEPGGLQSTGLQGVGHDWATNIFTRLPLQSLSQRSEAPVLESHSGSDTFSFLSLLINFIAV